MNKIKRLKYACYSANVTMSVVGNLSPVLFLTFRSLYGISYSLLGLLVLINFTTQLIVDLIFSFFSHKFNIAKTVKSIPLIAVFGFLVYALWPFLLPGHVYVGLVIGTVIFSAASGLCEVLISPVIAAIPSDDPDREMSKLHSVYAWGVVFVITVSTLFLLLIGNEYWQFLALGLTLIPLISAFLFSGSEVPAMETPKQTAGALHLLCNRGVWLCVLAIFLGGAAECTMAQWSSGYLEQALGIPKLWGDLFGVAVFSVMLGLGRSLYAKIGKNIGRVLTFGAIGATVCYFAKCVQEKFRFDDALEVWRAHGMGGVTGALLIGVFASRAINTVQASFEQFFLQLLGIAVVGAWSFVASWLILKVISRFGPIHVSREQELQGLDEALHGESAYRL